MPELPPPDDGPPDDVHLTLDEALDVLAALEDARDALLSSSYLTVVLVVEAEIRMLSRTLGFDAPEGGTDD